MSTAFLAMISIAFCAALRYPAMSIRCSTLQEIDVSGNYPIYEVSVIESEDGKTLRMGNDCIDRLTGQSVSE
jgi:hypothetical protein